VKTDERLYRPIEIGELRRDTAAAQSPPYMLVVLAAYLLPPVVIGHGTSYWVSATSYASLVCGRRGWPAATVGTRTEGWAAVGGLLVAVYCLPWLTLDNTRPLIGMPPWSTRTLSLLAEDPVNVLFATNLALADDCQLTGVAVRQAGCTQVGLNAGWDFLGYPLWSVLDATQSGVRIEVRNSNERHAVRGAKRIPIASLQGAE
jgi:hypothetical protein